MTEKIKMIGVRLGQEDYDRLIKAQEILGLRSQVEVVRLYLKQGAIKTIQGVEQ